MAVGRSGTEQATMVDGVGMIPHMIPHDTSEYLILRALDFGGSKRQAPSGVGVGGLEGVMAAESVNIDP